MLPAPDRSRHRGGFSLVEMMVVLLIMASLVTAASVSVGTTRDKVRADKTVSIGREVVEALERSEGLSFVSDFGRLPDMNEEEIQFLFSPTLRDAGLDSRSADTYKLRKITLPSTTSPPSWATSAFGEPYLGAGWRGPYSDALDLEVVDGEPTEILDGWKKRWEIDTATVKEMRNGVETDVQKLDALRSTGRDGSSDVDVSPMVWQDEDFPISIGRNKVTDNIDLRINVIVRGKDGLQRTSKTDFTALTLKVFYFAPEFDTYLAEDDPSDPASENKNIGWVEFAWSLSSPDSWSPIWEESSRPEYIEDDEDPATELNPFNPTIRGLTAGHRMIYAYAEGSDFGGSGHFVGTPKSVHLRPGTNSIEYTLSELP